MNNTIEVVIVEDDPGDTLLALEVLAELALIERSVVLGSAEEAMEFLRAAGRYAERRPGLPRVILLDLKMPGMDGFALLEELKADAALAEIPVVVLSSSDERIDVERARALGACEYLVKGVDFESYRAALFALERFRQSLAQGAAVAEGRA